ncbi:MAG: 8-amino-7-oxononanoate synthase [Nocardioidaceae bacterium]
MSFDDWLAEQAEQREAAGLTRRLVESDRDPLLDLAGNDYLGLARDPRVIAGAVAASREYGAGAAASRLVSGTLSIHGRLEDSLAEFMGFPAALAFSTGYHANLAVVTALADADTLIVSDAHIHASLVDACRLSRGTTRIVPHNDVSAVGRALAERTQARALVLAESIYSVFGDAAPLTELARVCATHGAVLVVDEAHALGVVGDGGRGLLRAAGLSDRPDVVATVTLSKSLGSQGGAVLGSGAVREHLVNRARAFIYDTGLAPAAAGAAVAALEVIVAEPDRVARATRASALLAEACEVERPDAAVLSVAMPGPREAVEAVARAATQGVRVGCFRPPSTPDGSSRLRLTAHAHHTDEELALATKVLREVR